LISQANADRNGAIRNYIYKNASTHASLEDLAGELNLSVSRASHLVKELFGSSFQELLLNERINRAKNLLLSTGDSVKEIAVRIGLPDEYYFNRIFKKQTGLPPGKFRRSQK
jgi:two-component system response regulator YesN